MEEFICLSECRVDYHADPFVQGLIDRVEQARVKSSNEQHCRDLDNLAAVLLRLQSECKRVRCKKHSATPDGAQAPSGPGPTAPRPSLVHARSSVNTLHKPCQVPASERLKAMLGGHATPSIANAPVTSKNVEESGGWASMDLDVTAGLDTIDALYAIPSQTPTIFPARSGVKKSSRGHRLAGMLPKWGFLGVWMTAHLIQWLCSRLYTAVFAERFHFVYRPGLPEVGRLLWV